MPTARGWRRRSVPSSVQSSAPKRWLRPASKGFGAPPAGFSTMPSAPIRSTPRNRPRLCICPVTISTHAPVAGPPGPHAASRRSACSASVDATWPGGTSRPARAELEAAAALDHAAALGLELTEMLPGVEVHQEVLHGEAAADAAVPDLDARDVEGLRRGQAHEPAGLGVRPGGHNQAGEAELQR